MRLRPHLLALALVSSTLAAQQVVQDPANLAGERTVPHDPADTLAIDHGAPALEQLLLKLRTRASLMLIVAHPDDEDGGMLTYESRGAGARVAMLTLTRGEGGQNLMSADFNDALGLLRTQEILAADRYMGVDQFFGTEVDFGFSKTREEALGQWTHDRVLYDAVRAVRLYRPLVLASVFVGGPTDGHGHHQVAGEITQEVFLAAADPKVFPEMIAQGLAPWAPMRVFARVPFSRVTTEGMYDYATGQTVPTLFHNYVTGADTHAVPIASVDIHEGDRATVRFGAGPAAPALGMGGLSYIQFARQGLAQQKTQIGPGVRLAPSGRADSGYTLMAQCAACPSLTPGSSADLFAGLDTSLASIADLAPTSPVNLRHFLTDIDAKFAEAQTLFDSSNLELSAPPLRDALRALDTLISVVDESKFDGKSNVLHELRIKRVQLNEALVLAHGLTLQATLASPTQPLTTLTSLAANLTLTNASANSIRIAATRLTVNLAGEGIGATPNKKLEPHTTETLPLRLPYLAGLPATRPFFSRPTLAQPFYDIATPALRNAPATPAPLVAYATLDDQGVRIDLAADVLPTPNSIQPAVIVPPLSIQISPTAAILRPAESSLALTLHLTGPGTTCISAPGAPPEGKLGLTLPAGWTVSPDTQPFDPGCPPAASVFTVTPAPGASGQALAIARFGAHNYTESFRPVGYLGLPSTNFYTPATLRAVAVDVATAPGLRVAYLPGTGDEVPAFLPNLGLTPTYLTPIDLTPASLARFDVILLGVRAYDAYPELQGPGSKPLIDFATAGGVVIAQYDSGGFDPASAPYPYTLPGDPAHNVVVETDPVILLAPEASILNWPNKITDADFNGWTEERGHGFPATWDSHYLAPLETHDPGQDPQQGGLLVATVGRGAWIYCAFALYRQLPEAVPGAYRLTANLLSYVKNPYRHP